MLHKKNTYDYRCSQTTPKSHFCHFHAQLDTKNTYSTLNSPGTKKVWSMVISKIDLNKKKWRTTSPKPSITASANTCKTLDSVNKLAYKWQLLSKFLFKFITLIMMFFIFLALVCLISKRQPKGLTKNYKFPFLKGRWRG